RFPELRGKMDRNQIGVGGHSYGGFTAMLISGARTFSNPPLSMADPRVRAALVMSPQGTAQNRGLTPQSWSDVRIPVMYMTGTNDRGAAESETPDWRRQAFEYSPPGDKYFVLIPGANHISFTGALGVFDLPPEMPRQTINQPGGMTPVQQQRPGFLDELALRRSLLALRFVALGPEVGGGSLTPDRRAFDSPMAMACLVDRAPCFPSRMCSISSRTNSPACVLGAFPSALSRLARS